MAEFRLHGDILTASFGSLGFFFYGADDRSGGLALVAGPRAPTLFRFAPRAQRAQDAGVPVPNTVALAGRPELEARALALGSLVGLAGVKAVAASGAPASAPGGSAFFGRRPAPAAAGSTMTRTNQTRQTLQTESRFLQLLAPSVERLDARETIELLSAGGAGIEAALRRLSETLRAPAWFDPKAVLFSLSLAEHAKAFAGLDVERSAHILRNSPDAPLDAWIWYGVRPSAEDVARVNHVQGLQFQAQQADSERLAIDRSQAGRAQSVLAGVIGSDPVFQRAVDARSSLAQALTARFGLAPASIKRLGKIDDPGERLQAEEERGAPLRGEDALGIDRVRTRFAGGSVSMADCLDVLSRLPPDWTPSDAPSWRSFTRVVSAALPLIRLYDLDVAEAFSSARGKWPDYERSLMKAAGYGSTAEPSRKSLALAVADAMESVHSMAVDVLLIPDVRRAHKAGVTLPPPSMFHVEAAHKAVISLTFGASGIVGLMENSRRWIGEMTRFSGRAAGEEGAVAPNLLETPEAFRPFTAANGLVVRHLLNEERIEKESARLGHCVGHSSMPYRKGNKEGRLHILSIGDAGDTLSLSTVEIDPLLPGEPFRVRQNQGSVQQGRRVPEAAEQAFEEFRLALEAGALAVDREHIRRAAEVWADWKTRNDKGVPKTLENWQRYLGGRILQPEAADEFYFDAWAGVVKKSAGELRQAADDYYLTIAPVTVSERIASFGRA